MDTDNSDQDPGLALYTIEVIPGPGNLFSWVVRLAGEVFQQSDHPCSTAAEAQHRALVRIEHIRAQRD